MDENSVSDWHTRNPYIGMEVIIMYRVATQLLTGKLIEMQSGGKVERLTWMEWSLSVKEPKDRSEEKYQEYLNECDALEASRLDTLKQNALNAGYKEDDIEVKWVTDEEWAVIEATLNQPTPEQIAEKEREALIQAKIREMAEAELIAEGKMVAEK